ncbi:gamma-glutamyl-gamma-aminobutyrate hydrolase family protein [Acetivibrio mesophilus]|uniref:Gamma-glutamyl-gamma-aminobutyrate hydrolase family protein n=1 Tax=Acetivibrio mesophilus TaxID=2487273 RepID=A0A4Q0I4V5_9FIRM|nr:type 1 glutamine amidotransferase [Acetivibrio mesophilus]ODM28162.1 peptidase C26 [Clostridium sp. Bc-iso-3]RXE59350.1 gamma-glutamyl-gamma-aminobutyrate hydrolase family protein [Acetivibrio mesophilus]HHV29934.1 type 1 glutamine amidotransferase [Clostridium sp.]
MVKNRPIIGITPWFDYNENKMYINRAYCEAITLSGGMPVLLSIEEDEGLLSEMIDVFDGFLLSGGPDVDAVHWGEWNYKYNGEISPYRDKMELFIARKAVGKDKPIFGICRGIQVLNVAFGGTLYQDIYSQNNEKDLIKHSQNAPKWYPTHKVTLKEGSIVQKAHGAEVISVNSFHHQAVREPASDFIITARSEDGIIEAIEHSNCKFAVGVQWHPEHMWKKDSSFLNLFRCFVRSCM